MDEIGFLLWPVLSFENQMQVESYHYLRKSHQRFGKKIKPFHTMKKLATIAWSHSCFSLNADVTSLEISSS
jgi:hypothetical protein